MKLIILVLFGIGVACSHKGEAGADVLIEKKLLFSTDRHLTDAYLSDFQPISQNKFLLLGDFPQSAGVSSRLVELGTEGLKPFSLSDELAKLGHVAAMSNLEGGHIAVLLEKLEDKARHVKSLHLALIDTDNSRIDSVIDLLAQIPAKSKPWRAGSFDDRQYGLLLLKSKIVAVSAISNHRHFFAADFKTGIVEEHKVIGSSAKETFVFTPLIAKGDDVIFSAMDVNESEYREFQKTHSLPMDKPKCFQGESAFIYARAMGGRVLDGFLVCPQNKHDSVLGALAVEGDKIAVITTSSGVNNLKKPMVTLLRFDRMVRQFEQVWSHTYEFTKDSDSLVTAGFWKGHGLLVGGAVGYLQARTGSVVQASNAFIGLVNVANGDVLWSEILEKTVRRDSVDLIRLSPELEHPMIYQTENFPLTHEEKAEPIYGSFFGLDGMSGGTVMKKGDRINEEF